MIFVNVLVLGLALIIESVQLSGTQKLDAVVMKSLNETTVAVETVNKSDNETVTKHILTSWFFDPANLKKLLNLPVTENDQISKILKRHTYAESINRIQRKRKNKSLDPLITLHMGDVGSPRRRKQTGEEEFYQGSLQPETFISPENERQISVFSRLRDKAYKSIAESSGRNITVKPATVLTVLPNNEPLGLDGFPELGPTISALPNNNEPVGIDEFAEPGPTISALPNNETLGLDGFAEPGPTTSAPTEENANQIFEPITTTVPSTITLAETTSEISLGNRITNATVVFEETTHSATMVFEGTTHSPTKKASSSEVGATAATTALQNFAGVSTRKSTEETKPEDPATVEEYVFTTKPLVDKFTETKLLTSVAEQHKSFPTSSSTDLNHISVSSSKPSTIATISNVDDVRHSFTGYQTIKFSNFQTAEESAVEDAEDVETTTNTETVSALDMVLPPGTSTTKQSRVQVAAVKVVPIVQREYTVLLIGIVLTCFGTILVVGGLVFFFYYQKKKSSPNAVEMRSSRLYDDV